MGLNKMVDLIELSSFLSAIPSDAYILLSQILIVWHYSVKSTRSWLDDTGQ